MNKILKSLGLLIGVGITHIIGGLIIMVILSILGKDLSCIDSYKYTLNLIASLISLIILNLMFFDDNDKLLSKNLLNKMDFKNIIYVALFGIGYSIIMANFIGLLMELIPDYMNQYCTGIKNETNIISSSLVQVMAVTVFGPIYEEIIFRRIIFDHLKKNYNIISAVIVQALIFGLLHSNLIQDLSAFISGIVLVLLYIRYNSLLASITLHIVFNSMVMLINNNLIGGSVILDSILIIVAILCLIFSIYKMTRKDEKIYINNY
ncbi:CPBP family intramembrane glutamic endopeptidase [Romboutsia lituseburensis]|uniref:CPBP family intramembrane glutamic endopeptidase n=1 Tax=Romboutsia lituseburensis TaxID=1537 RepID=UPI00215B185D|nr:CPBP family intramembrane metalloprotease [Romboutsia lituseburensis]MCR8746896.1 CPBP family intramembrane metalloprotease [Romboutsia lituseburensis]